MIDLSFLHHLDRLSLIINKRITSNYVGERKSIATGRGLVFKDHIIYAPGDDFRYIDWKVYGRLDKLFVKRFEEERNLTVHIIVDYSASMGFGKKQTKAEYASMFGIGFAYMAMKNNERFVLSTFSNVLEPFKAHKGRSQLISIVDYLNKKKPQGLSKLDDSLGRYKKLINSKSMVIILSDFLYSVQDIRQAIARFKRHNVVLIQVLDQEEETLPLDGDFKLIDTETKETLRTFVSPYLRKKYTESMDNHRAEIKRACDEINAKFFTFHTGSPIFDAFYQVLSA